MKLRYSLIVILLWIIFPAAAIVATAQEDTPTPESPPTEEPPTVNVEGSDTITVDEQSTGDITISDSDVIIPSGDDATTTITVDTDTSSPSPAEDTLGWIMTLFGVWVMWSLSVRTAFEKTVKPVLDWGFMWFGISKGTTKASIGYPARTFVVVVGVIAAAYLTAYGLNIFDGAPPSLHEGLSLEVERIFTAVFLAMGAFLFHDAIVWWTDDNV